MSENSLRKLEIIEQTAFMSEAHKFLYYQRYKQAMPINITKEEYQALKDKLELALSEDIKCKEADLPFEITVGEERRRNFDAVYSLENESSFFSITTMLYKLGLAEHSGYFDLRSKRRKFIWTEMENAHFLEKLNAVNNPFLVRGYATLIEKQLISKTYRGNIEPSIKDVLEYKINEDNSNILEAITAVSDPDEEVIDSWDTETEEIEIINLGDTPNIKNCFESCYIITTASNRNIVELFDSLLAFNKYISELSSLYIETDRDSLLKEIGLKDESDMLEYKELLITTLNAIIVCYRTTTDAQVLYALASSLQYKNGLYHFVETSSYMRGWSEQFEHRLKKHKNAISAQFMEVILGRELLNFMFHPSEAAFKYFPGREEELVAKIASIISNLEQN